MNSVPAPRTRSTALPWLILAAAWLTHLGISTLGWDNTLLGHHQFRQVQTALASHFFPGTGFPFDYPLPLLGPPWSVPLEFPLYQALAAWCSRITGLALDPSGRLVSWLFFQASLPACYLFLGSLGIRSGRPLILALIVTSPLHLYFARTFMIESTAQCCALWFLAGYCRWFSSGKWWWLVSTAITGALAALIKPPTLFVYCVAGGLFTVWQFRSLCFKQVAVRSLLALPAPVAAGLAWQLYTARIRLLNPDAAFLDVMFGYFSFGDLALRLKPAFWLETTNHWFHVLGESGAVLALLLLLRLDAPRRLVSLGLFAAFLSGPLVFANLYFVHGYYFYANGVFLILAAGTALLALEDIPTFPRWSLPVASGIIVLFQLGTYARHYLAQQTTDVPVPKLARVLQQLTDPEDMIVVLGQDWDATLPYYAQRRALMLIAGRERDMASIARSVSRIEPEKVGAVVLFGHVREDGTFAGRALGRFDLGATPLLLSRTEQVGIWIPRSRQARVKDRIPENGFASFDLVVSRRADQGAQYFGRRDLNRMRELDLLGLRPVAASTVGTFTTSTVDGQEMLNAHAPSELVFRAPSGSGRLHLRFGIHEGAYRDPQKGTDGVEFSLSVRDRAGNERKLYQRLLDPARQGGDQGIQAADLEIAPANAAELVLRIDSGPAGNASFDWAYVGELAFSPGPQPK